MAPICGFHSHSSALTQQGPNLPKPVRTHAALTCFHHFHASRTHPHSWRHYDVFAALIRTHPHSSALIRTHPHDPCAYASTHLPHLRVSGCLAESLCRLDVLLHAISTLSSSKSVIFIHEPKQYKTIVFLKNNSFPKKYVKKEKTKFHNFQITSRHALFLKTLT